MCMHALTHTAHIYFLTLFAARLTGKDHIYIYIYIYSSIELTNSTENQESMIKRKKTQIIKAPV
jgi:hypothetical protein